MLILDLFGDSKVLEFFGFFWGDFFEIEKFLWEIIDEVLIRI